MRLNEIVCEGTREREKESVYNKYIWGKSYCYCVLVCTVIFAITVKAKDKHLDSFNVIREAKR